MLSERFGSLIVLEKFEEQNIAGHIRLKCKCDCGSITIVTQNNLLRGNTTRCVPCGKKARILSSTKYDVKNHKGAYSSYRSMLLRCSQHQKYLHVKVCDAWLNPDTGFLNFLNDMGDRPEKHTLDRINNDLGYDKTNCRWATYSVQSHNKRSRVGTNHSSFKGVSFDKRTNNWICQFYENDNRFIFCFELEKDAAIKYDNLSEIYFGDRPNKTELKEVTNLVRKSGGVTYCKKSGLFRVRISEDGNRKTICYCKSYDEALTRLNKYKHEVADHTS